jgi:hypothetical protein
MQTNQWLKGIQLNNSATLTVQPLCSAKIEGKVDCKEGKKTYPKKVWHLAAIMGLTCLVPTRLKRFYNQLCSLRKGSEKMLTINMYRLYGEKLELTLGIKYYF